MYATRDWIKQYTEIDLQDDELLSALPQRLGEVEYSEDFSKKYEGIVLAQITSVEPHPQSDKLSVCKIDIGQNDDITVVAGGTDLQVGEKVAYMPVGTRLPLGIQEVGNQITISKRKVRGVESEGMIASAKELDYGIDHTKVFRIDTDAKPGTPIAEVLEMDDLVFSIENKALTNRPDCFGILGLAREISAMQGKAFNAPSWYTEPASNRPKQDDAQLQHRLNISVETPTICPRYMGVVVRDIKIKQSPIWLSSLLAKVGIKSINNVVDITNYVSHLMAQPMHAFDYDKFVARDKKLKDTNEANIVVRKAKSGEKLSALNGKTVELSDETLVIADSANPVAIAGVIGGTDTEIDDNTTTIILEVANFDLYAIRKTSMRHGIFTDSVTKYARGQSAWQVEPAMYKALELLKELADGRISSSITDIYPDPRPRKTITVHIDKLNRHIGIEFTADQVIDILTKIEFEVAQPSDGKTIDLLVPMFRTDILSEVDIYEEVVRVYGYEHVKLALPTRPVEPVPQDPMLALKNRFRHLLATNGAHEILTYNFVGAKLYDKASLSLTNAFHIKNATSPDLEYMRTHLMPSLLQKAQLNAQSGYKEFALFELNKAHSTQEKDPKSKLPVERNRIGLISVRQPVKDAQISPYYNAKAYADLLLSEFRADSIRYTLVSKTTDMDLPAWVQEMLPALDPHQSALVEWQDGENGVKFPIGVVGVPIDAVRKAFKLDGKDIAILEFDTEIILKLPSSRSKYVEPSRFPPVYQDLCFVLDRDTHYSDVLTAISSRLADQPNIYMEVTPVDIYQDEQLEADNKKQVTFNIALYDRSRTIDSATANKYISKIVKYISKTFDAKLK